MFKSRSIRLDPNIPHQLTIKRNEQGVMCIDADDIAGMLWGSGYAHGVDRYTQLLLMRILGQGRLCELLEDSDENLAIDTFFRRANWHNNLSNEVEKLDEYTRSMCQNYCDGVNAALKKKRFSILKLLGYQPIPWTIKDSILISRMTGYLTLAQSQAEIEHLFIECVQAGIDITLLEELFPIKNQDIDVALLRKIRLQDNILPNEMLWNSVLPRMMASNNWVISGQRTASGKAILASDPHLEINRLPNVWCEQSLSCSQVNVKGMSMPGLPSIVIGRSQHLSWGVTYSFMDSVDSWIEDCNDGHYKKHKQWRSFDTRKEIVKRKKNATHTLTFFDNEHGVLAGDPYKKGYYLATRWSGAQSGAMSLQAGIKMLSITSTEQALITLGQVESAWNWVVTDSEDNIGYQMSGLMPKRHRRWNGFSPAKGWLPEYDWCGYVTYDELPRILNPKAGYVVTANNDLNHLGVVSPINMPMGNYRAQRIEDKLNSTDQHDVNFSQQMQLDVYSKQARLFLDILLPILVKSESDNSSYKILRDWDCRYDNNSVGAPIFEAFYHSLREQIFISNELGFGERVGKHLVQETGVFIDFYQQFDNIMLNPNSSWLGNKSQEDIFLNAFQHMKIPKYVYWKQQNTVCFTNILLTDKLPKFLRVSTDPIPLQGGRATPCQGQIYRNANRITSFAPTVRVVCDMSESTLHTCLAGGASDNPLSIWYRNELNDWLNGRYKII